MTMGVAVVRLQTWSLPLWPYGYITPPPNPGDYTTRCTGANPGDCGRGTLPSDPANTPRRLEGSERTFTLAEINAPFAPADWFPTDHPPMPDIVARGKEAIGARACSMCHLSNGKGLMQNGPVAGLPVEYFLRQIADFKSGKRRSADVNKANAYEMQAIARNLTDAEAKAAAEYFGAIPFTPWVKVVESETVPKFTATVNGLFLKSEGEATEPLGRRLVEMPENTHDTNILRSPRSGFVVYAPPGSLQKGETLAKGCLTCHGPDLRGTRLAPPIAGRQASYIARQIWDMKLGARNGDAAKAMKPAVEKITEEDLIAITAYVSSRQP
jgi:cytochrome c553